VSKSEKPTSNVYGNEFRAWMGSASSAFSIFVRSSVFTLSLTHTYTHFRLSSSTSSPTSHDLFLSPFHLPCPSTPPPLDLPLTNTFSLSPPLPSFPQIYRARSSILPTHTKLLQNRPQPNPPRIGNQAHKPQTHILDLVVLV
jgi:hypothetical protein